VSAQPSEASKPAGLDRAAIAAWTRRSRAASGRGPKIEDRPALAKLVTLALAGDDDAASRRHQGREAVEAGSASGAVLRERSGSPNSKGPGLTNRDLRKTTLRSTEEVVRA
jgi:hypothetical protein